MLLIEDFLATGRGDALRQLPVFAAGCAVSRLRLDDLAVRCEAEGEEEVANLYLCRSELLQWRGFYLPRRRLEWLGGRIAAKDASLRWGGVAAGERDWQQWQLAKLPSGRPELVAGVAPLPEISISHSADQVVAISMANRCGVDIQQRRDSLLRVKSRFCQQSEEVHLLASLGEVDDISRLALLWSAKEAIRKAVPVTVLPAFGEMELMAVRGLTHGLMIFECCFRRDNQSLPLEVAVVLDGDYAVALVAIPTGKKLGEK